MEVKNNLEGCPICGHQTYILFSAPCDYRKPIKSELYEVYWCDVCDYGQVWERPTKEKVSSFYELDSYYTHQDSAINVGKLEEKVSFFDKLRTHVSWRIDRGEDLMPHDAMSLLQGDSLTILEIGCGSGGNLLKFIEKGFSATGVEPDPEARKASKKAGLNVFDGTAEELPKVILNSKYDVVLMSHVLEHCLDVNTAISNVKSILKTNGVFIVETPNCMSHGFKDYKAAWPWSDIPRHLNFFTNSSLNSILSKHGFNVISTKYRGFCRQFSNSWLKNEEEIWHSFKTCSADVNSKPNFKLRAWKLLLKSMFSSKTYKYDSIRLIAKNI
ncbi:hypothetical protein AU255_12435 [Methyloprofundus sedimenti]|uniref:Methyltransferase n=1 Tax=Methyloprofundus sedimenti TaxID=1420851 RepID=A0A1V8MAG2_9GAMM|nr:class I SAM-dependent methyltransferase [Methyloprofundus sedimenti]OQK18581.1 hypothetical protein AU255_12435 [Methyloprofundus sedimenti]